MTAQNNRRILRIAGGKSGRRSPATAAKKLRTWIADAAPDAVIIEKLTNRTRKGQRSRAIVEALAREAEQHELYDIVIARNQQYANKYEEAAAYAARFPEIAHLLPMRPRLWQSEPKKMIYFEAIALALAVVDPETRMD